MIYGALVGIIGDLPDPFFDHVDVYADFLAGSSHGGCAPLRPLGVARRHLGCGARSADLTRLLTHAHPPDPEVEPFCTDLSLIDIDCFPLLDRSERDGRDLLRP